MLKLWMRKIKASGRMMLREEDKIIWWSLALPPLDVFMKLRVPDDDESSWYLHKTKITSYKDALLLPTKPPLPPNLDNGLAFPSWPTSQRSAEGQKFLPFLLPAVRSLANLHHSSCLTLILPFPTSRDPFSRHFRPVVIHYSELLTSQFPFQLLALYSCICESWPVP